MTRETTPEAGPSYEPPDDLDLESIPGVIDIDNIYTPYQGEGPSRKRPRNVPLEQPTGARKTRQDSTVVLLRGIKEDVEIIKEDLKSFIERSEGEWMQARKDREAFLRGQERLVQIMQECQNRLGVAEIRILALQEARRDKAIQNIPLTHTLKHPTEKRGMRGTEPAKALVLSGSPLDLRIDTSHY